MNLEQRATVQLLTEQTGRGELSFPTSAAVALRVRQALDEPDCHIETAARLIQTEPLLAARIVAVANSVAFNRSGRTITDVRAAVNIVGFQTGRTLATAVIARQLAAALEVPAHRAFAAQLWEHTAHVAALAQVIARRVMKQDPETAMFAGIVHEIGGFYLLSRMKDYPRLLDSGSWDVADDESAPESGIGRAVCKALSVPATVVAALEVLWEGYLTYPPSTLGDTLLLADQLAPVKSPFASSAHCEREDVTAALDLLVGQDTLLGILDEAAEEVTSLTAALKF